MSVSKDKVTGSWQYNFMYKGIRYHRRFKNAGYDEVAGYEAIAKAELRKNGYDIAKENKTYTLSQIIDDYLEYAENNYSRTDDVKIIINRFYSIIGNKQTNDITVSDVEKYRSVRKDKVKNSSINREVDNIKRMFSLAYSNRKIKENPCRDLNDLKIVNPTKRYLTKEEETLLLAATNPIMRAIIIVAIHTGMRSSEIKNLKWSDVFLEHDYLIALNTKNGKSRELLITPQMKEELLKLPKISEYVFVNPLTLQPYKDFKTTFSRAVKRAGIPHITFHELRHTTASRLNELGVDLATIQEYLDHADARTTQGYIHKPRKNIIDAIDRLSKY